MKKVLRNLSIALFAMMMFFGASMLFTRCEIVDPGPDCETYNEGDVRFRNNAPASMWDGCYLEVDWSDGSYNTADFLVLKTYYDKPAGSAFVYAEWEDYSFYYYASGYCTLVACSTVDVYLWNYYKKSTSTSEFVTGKRLKSDFDSREDFRNSIKK